MPVMPSMPPDLSKDVRDVTIQTIVEEDSQSGRQERVTFVSREYTKGEERSTGQHRKGEARITLVPADRRVAYSTSPVAGGSVVKGAPKVGEVTLE